ncbi:helix-turn-helix domain-containing protein [Flavobacterium macrobrachii]|uniref:Helix-turn-helix domain-containing protein n=1 Tax=Flavobacterium macrobrachii TaxID=591204 RepID=A0ABS2CZ03_9FLAO|nr:helix-turn-helix domain-containing protein [Flavobacterium macrobrachii]MBM6500196.1 helix-turn-helix domain-containing protein [Flavobacterium macrobrachii]
MLEKTILRELRLLKKEVKQRNLYRKRLLTIEEAAKLSGVSVSYIQKLTSSKQIPHSKPTGKLIFIHRKDLETFLSQNYISSNDEVNSNVSDYLLRNKK